MGGPVEPAANLRELASFYYQMYVALVAEGFTEQQALRIIGETVRGIWGLAKGGDAS